MAESLNELLAADVSVLDLAAVLDGKGDLTAEEQQIFMPVIGATLRGIKKPASTDDKSKEAA